MGFWDLVLSLVWRWWVWDVVCVILIRVQVVMVVLVRIVWDSIFQLILWGWIGLWFFCLYLVLIKIRGVCVCVWVLQLLFFQGVEFGFFLRGFFQVVLEFVFVWGLGNKVFFFLGLGYWGGRVWGFIQGLFYFWQCFGWWYLRQFCSICNWGEGVCFFGRREGYLGKGRREGGKGCFYSYVYDQVGFFLVFQVF